MGMQSGTATLEDSWSVSYEIKHTLIVQANKSTPIYLPKINKNICLLKNLLTDVYSSSVHSHQELETSKSSVRQLMNG